MLVGSSLLLSPSPLPERHLLARRRTAAVRLCAPGPVLAQPRLGVRGIVKFYLGDGSLDQSPDPPVEARQSPEDVDFGEQLLYLGSLVDLAGLVMQLAEVGM